ncbi:hypothetical protein HPG69_006647, partial [Diceros bicornis minor]
IMASASTMSNENSSSCDSESGSDTESDSFDDSETTESLSSFDQSEEEDHLSLEDVIEEPASGQFPCEFEISEEKPSKFEATDVSSCDLERSGLTECKGILRKLSLSIWETLSKSKVMDAENMYLNYPDLLALQWELFLEECYPHFIIVSEMGITPCQTDVLNIFIIHSLKNKIHIVLPQGIQSDVLRIYGYCASSCHSHRRFFEMHEKQLRHALHAYIIDYCQKSQETGIFLYGHLKLNLGDMQKEIHQTLSLLQNLWPEGADIRNVVCSVSCSVALILYKNDLKKPPTLNEAADLCRMLCLSVIFLQHLPLFQRAKSRIITYIWDRTLAPFLLMLKRCEFFILKQLKSGNNWNVNFAGLPDLTDNTLWKNIAYYYEIEYSRGLNLGLGDTLIQEYLKLWNTVLTLSGDGGFGGSMPLRTTSRPFLTQRETSPGVMTQLFYLFLKRENLMNSHTGILLDLSVMILKGLRATVMKTNAEKFIEENQKRQLAKLEKREEERWNNLSLHIEKEIKENPKSGIKRLDNFLQICYVKSVKFTAEMAGMDACFKLWVENCLKTEAESRDISIIINLMKRIHRIHEKYSELLQNTHRRKLARYLRYIGFDNLAHSVCPQVDEMLSVSGGMEGIHGEDINSDDWRERGGLASLPLPPEQVEKSGTEKDISKYSVQMGAARFQLTYMGPYLFQEERSDPDPRVHHFIPDTWQRELLDVVDKNESAVIVAPTSSGKTYASYYCMEKILREGNEGGGCICCSNKALVNQVVGVVWDLFTKALPEGLVVCGVFTRDYRHDALNCQILVTVPQCLEILLLSPHNEKWVKRMRYVIFDEVHCLGGEIGAEVWEHLLVMIRCSFLALSATNQWLVLIKRYWQHVEMWYKERYNDLEKYVCSLKGNDFLIEHYRPCAALTANHIEKYGIPSDLGFSPRESILLYDAMVHVWPEWPRMQELEPEEFSCFKNKVVITRGDAKKYEEELKKEMIHWIQLDRSKVNQLLKYLKPQTFDSSENEKRRMFPCFVEKLKEMDRLPAIFFSSFKEKFNVVESSASQLLTNLIIKQNTHNNPNSEREKKTLNKKLWKAMRSQKRNYTAFLNSDSSSRIQRIILWEAEIKEIKKNLKKHEEVSPDCTYTDHTVVDNQLLKAA